MKNDPLHFVVGQIDNIIRMVAKSPLPLRVESIHVFCTDPRNSSVGIGTKSTSTVGHLLASAHHLRYRYCVATVRNGDRCFFSEGGCRPCTIRVLLYYPRLEVSADLKLLEQLCCSTDGKSRLATVGRQTFKRSLTAECAKMVGFEKRRSQTRSSLRYFRKHLVRGAGQNPTGRKA